MCDINLFNIDLRKLIIYFVFISVFGSGFAQNPGNVGTTNITAWFKPDGLSIGNLSSWTTTFPSGANAFSVTDGGAPYPQATQTPAGNSSNYNTTVHFTNSNSSPDQRLVNTSSLDLLDNFGSTSQGTLVCAYYLPMATSNDHFITYNEVLDGIQLRNLGTSGRMAIGKTSNSANATRNWQESYKPQLISYKGNRSSFGTMKMYNQSYLTTASSVSGSSGASGLYLGVKPNGGTGFQGNSGLSGFLHEIIFYDRDLTVTELLKVHSYLAIKFGVTFKNSGGGTQGDYISTTGLTVWDASVNPVYHHDVIGISRDDTQGLLQKQSHSFDDITRVYLDSLKGYNALNSAAFSSNVSYLMVGDNSAIVCATTASNNEIPPGTNITARLAREWKITNTNLSDSLNFDLTTSNCGQFANASCLRLLIDDDGDFTNATVYASGSGLEITNTNGVITVRGVSNNLIPINSTRYLTIGVIEPEVNFGPDTTICPGDNIVLNATILNGVYQWQDNSVDSLFTVIVPGFYWVEVDVNGCVNSDSIQISMGAGPLVNLGNDTSICIGDTLVLDATNTGASYLWHDGSSNPSLSIYSTGLSWVDVSDGCGTVRDSFDLMVTPYPIVNLGADSILCDGDTLYVGDIQMGASYSWQNGSTDSIYGSSNTETIWLDLTLNSCTTRDSVETVFNPMPVIQLGPDTSICMGDTLTLNASNPGANYIWQDNSVNSVLSVFATGQYWVEVTLANCVASDTMDLTITPLPVVNLGSNQVVCNGDQFYLDAYNVNGTYLWNDGSTNFNLLVTQTGTYWVDVTVSNCHSYDTVGYVFNTLPIIDLGPDTLICSPDVVLLDATYPNASYVWGDNSTAPTYLTGAAGNYSVTVTESNCTYKDSITISVEPKPLADLGADTVLCLGTSFTKGNVVSGAGYLWQDGAVTAFYQINTSGTYWVEVTKGLCKNSDTIWVDSATVPSVYLGEDTLLCVGDVMELSSMNSNSSYLWSTGSTDSSIWVSEPGEYWLDVSNICGTVRDEVELESVTLPQTDLGPDTTLCMGDVLDLEAYWYNASRYLWLDGSDLSYISVYEDGDYLVQVTNLCGAMEDTISVEFVQCDCNIYIPNAFTPNGDGLDEEFGPHSYCELKGYNFMVFNRWGMEMFNSIDPLEKWDGTFRGQPLAAGMYSYKLRYNFKKRGPKTDYKTLYGTVIILK